MMEALGAVAKPRLRPMEALTAASGLTVALDAIGGDGKEEGMGEENEEADF